jgi:methyl-accepting chemotaxis protein I, serine sensor receptor
MTISIKSRLAIATGLLAGLLLLVGGLGLTGMTGSNNANRDTYGSKLPSATYIDDAEINLQRERSALFRAALDPSAPDLRGIIEHSKDYRTEAAKQLARYKLLPRDAGEDALASDLYGRREAMDQGLDTFAQTLASGDGKRIMSATLANNDLYAAYHTSSARLRAFQYSAAKSSFDAQEHSFALFRIITLLSLGLGLITSVVAFVNLRQAISKPLGVALALFDKIADGDLTHSVKVTAHDEMGQLLEGLARMQERLRQTVRSVRSGSETIAAATQEMSAGNLDLSARTEEQAASLEETAASMVQLTATVKQNSDNAQQASGLAGTAREVAGQGSEIVGRVVGTMAEIGQSSNKIADIIGIIESIAFQTNILALNAAVEAARAGENGRGFAVVATEVRTLAQRSSGAAKEIKGLIDTSTDRVRIGTELVSQAGQTMEKITHAIFRVHDIIGEIAAASQEQSRGIEQVNQAISQMDEVTQQNAALVEEAAAAAGSLEDQAQKLRASVASFKTDQGVVPTSKHPLTSRLPTASSAPRRAERPVRLGERKPSLASSDRLDRKAALEPVLNSSRSSPAGGDWASF